MTDHTLNLLVFAIFVFIATLTIAAPTVIPLQSDVVVVKNAQGPGVLELKFEEIKVSDIPLHIVQAVGVSNMLSTVLQLTMNAKNFPSGEIFNFHIHEQKVQGNDCKTAAGHWDPLQVNPRFHGGKNEDYKPIPGQLSTFELGDLSGKHGAINSSGTRPQVIDKGNGIKVIYDPTIAHIDDLSHLSVVIHNSANDRIGCTNFRN